MRYANRIAILLLAVLLLCACQPVTRPLGPEVQPAQGLRPDAPSFAVHGPYAVGMREFSAAAGDHTVDLSVWYPALNPENAPESITYQVGANVPDVAGLPITGRAIADSALAIEQGPYPLVVFSPGLAGWKQANSYLLEHLASYGFVVIASDPRGETFTEFWEGASTRPVDTQAVIDFAEMSTAAGGDLAGLIDMDHIAVAGHSSGGWAALAGGGAQMDFGWCAANPAIVAENELSNCTQFVPHAEDIAAMRGLPSTPSGQWPPTNDPRVDAVVALAPDGDIWGADYQGVAAVKVPTLVMAGSADTVNIPERCAYPVYAHLGSAKKTMITFAGGDHMIFFNQCRNTPWMLPDMFWACSDAVWDMDRAHDLINHFVTAFLLAELKGDGEAAAALAPENVNFPGIQYETTGYAAAAPEPPLDAAITAKIESILTNSMQSAGVPGYAMCAVKDGGVVYSKSFGTAELGKDLPVTPQSVFSLRSTSKSFTATALMQLVEQGKIDLDAPVTAYLPYFSMADPRYKDITVRMLATHTSGLVDDTTFATMPPKSEEPAATGAAIEWFVRSLADDTLTAAPLTDWQYAGTNFILLGDIIGKVAGEPYDVYITRHLLEPLGMVHSTLDKSAIPQGALVGEHVTAAGAVEAAPLSDYGGFEAPEGGIYSTCEDMARWMQVHINRGELDGVRILQPESYAVLWHGAAQTGLDAVFGQWIANIAVGWAVGEDQGHLLAGHPGGGAGQNIGFQLAPDDHLGVTVLANWGTEPDAYPAWTAAADILYAILGLAPH